MNLRVLPASIGLLSTLALSLGSAAIPPQAKAAPNPSGSYKVDGVHSAVLYKIKHMSASWSIGRFDKVTGNFSMNSASPEKSAVTVEVAADSIDSGNAQRDGDLKGPTFLDVIQFPSVTFASRTVKKSGDAKYTIEGDLTLHGVKKPLTVDFEQVGFSDTKMGVRAGFFGTFTVKRSDFGMKVAPEAIGDEVQMTISIEGVQTDSAAK
jgi:polyisoprenoid-binding protein YceI